MPKASKRSKVECKYCKVNNTPYKAHSSEFCAYKNGPYEGRFAEMTKALIAFKKEQKANQSQVPSSSASLPTPLTEQAAFISLKQTVDEDKISLVDAEDNLEYMNINLRGVNVRLTQQINDLKAQIKELQTNQANQTAQFDQAIQILKQKDDLIIRDVHIIRQQQIQQHQQIQNWENW